MFAAQTMAGLVVRGNSSSTGGLFFWDECRAREIKLEFVHLAIRRLFSEWNIANQIVFRTIYSREQKPPPKIIWLGGVPESHSLYNLIPIYLI